MGTGLGLVALSDVNSRPQLENVCGSHDEWYFHNLIIIEVIINR